MHVVRDRRWLEQREHRVGLALGLGEHGCDRAALGDEHLDELRHGPGRLPREERAGPVGKAPSVMRSQPMVESEVSISRPTTQPAVDLLVVGPPITAQEVRRLDVAGLFRLPFRLPQTKWIRARSRMRERLEGGLVLAGPGRLLGDDGEVGGRLGELERLPADRVRGLEAARPQIVPCPGPSAVLARS